MKKWAAILLVNGGALFALFLAFMALTDRYIAARAGSTLIYEGHPLHRQQPKPNQSVDVIGAHITIGAHGLRGEAPPMPKAKQETRVFVMGGSSVFDINAPISWPEALTTHLKQAGAPTVHVYNAGIPGFTSRESLALYEDKVRYLAPDIVLLYQGWNDAKYMRPFLDGVDVDGFFRLAADPGDAYRFLTEPRPVRNWYALMRRLDDLASGGRLQERVRVGRLKDAELIASDLDVDWENTPGMMFWRRNLQDFVHTVRADGAVPVLVVQATLVTPQLSDELRERVRYKFMDLGHKDVVELNELMVRVLQQVAQEERVEVIDVREGINGRGEYFTDHVHLSPAGSEAVAVAVSQALGAVLQRVGANGGVRGTGTTTLSHSLTH